MFQVWMQQHLFTNEVQLDCLACCDSFVIMRKIEQICTQLYPKKNECKWLVLFESCCFLLLCSLIFELECGVQHCFLDQDTSWICRKSAVAAKINRARNPSKSPSSWRLSQRPNPFLSGLWTRIDSFSESSASAESSARVCRPLRLPKTIQKWIACTETLLSEGIPMLEIQNKSCGGDSWNGSERWSGEKQGQHRGTRVLPEVLQYKPTSQAFLLMLAQFGCQVTQLLWKFLAFRIFAHCECILHCLKCEDPINPCWNAWSHEDWLWNLLLQQYSFASKL